MIEIALDASQLEAFEPCPRKWYYSYVLNLIPKRSVRSFDIGSYYHECLAHYYALPLKSPGITLTERMRSVIDFCARTELLHKFNIKSYDDQKFHRQRLIDYLFRYQDEDEITETIAIEQGFSYLLYEDERRKYILEGKIDMVAFTKSLGLFVRDHKTQSRKDDRWEFNHQVCNYLTATEANYFEYNYIGLQDKLPPNGLRRMIYKPHDGMLEQWKSEVLRTFDQLYNYIKANELHGIPLNEDKDLTPRRRSACDSSKYGLCSYYKLCSVPDNSKWVPAVFSAYKEKEEKWQAWKL